MGNFEGIATLVLFYLFLVLLSSLKVWIADRR